MPLEHLPAPLFGKKENPMVEYPLQTIHLLHCQAISHPLGYPPCESNYNKAVNHRKENSVQRAIICRVITTAIQHLHKETEIPPKQSHLHMTGTVLCSSNYSTITIHLPSQPSLELHSIRCILIWNYATKAIWDVYSSEITY